MTQQDAARRVSSRADNPDERARSVIVISAGMIVAALIFLPITYWFQPNPQARVAAYIADIAGIATFAGTIMLARRGRVAQAIVLIVSILTVLVPIVMLAARIVSSTPIAMLFSLLVAGVLVQPRQIWRVLLFDLLALYAVVYYLLATGYVLNDFDTPIVALMPVILIATALIGYLGSSAVQHERAALRRALDAQRLVELDLVKARDAAEAANRAKSAFLAHMSHELRTPLTAILGYTNLLSWRASAKADHELQADLGAIEAAGKHLLSLIDNVLDLSKIEAGALDLALETFEVAAMLRDLSATVQPLAARNGNQLRLGCDPALGSMRADATKLRQILLNLLSNAAKYTHNGTIALTVRAEAAAGRDWLIFSVADTGVGISPDDLPYLFQPFKRLLEPPNAARYEGTGLGLALSQHLCQMMGGEITVQSELNAGTTFVARLPRDVAAQPAPA